ncbi:MAG: alginate O-acetyltransferase complex protein AlgI [Myxococcota bacterium]
MLPQLEVARRFRWSNLRDGFGLALWGAFKKVAIADTLAPYVDKAFLLDDPAGPVVWAATTGFMLQLYADFSGYTDLARGTARMLGIDLVRNFDEPYLAATTQEFWQRWHISLSTWIRDYLLTPLLGNAAEIGPARFVFAVTVTMVVMGLWHGAGWNFVLFGLFQAAAIGGYALAQRHLPERVRTLRYGRTLAAAFHLLVVGELGALLFREHSVARIVQHLSKSPFAADADEWRVAVALLAIAAVLNVPLVIEHVVRRRVLPALEESEWLLPIQTTVWSLYMVGIGVAYRETGADFIYFQF